MEGDLTPTNSEGNPHGYWVMHDGDTGEINYKGAYVNGLEHGPWVEYHTHGRKRESGTYRNGEKIGVWFYYRSGEKVRRTEYIIRT